MSYSFYEGLPDGLKTDFDLGIFHDPAHLVLQASSGWITFVGTDDQTGKTHAILQVNINSADAKTPVRSPYGSFLFLERESTKHITDFIKFVEVELQKRNIHTFSIKHQPEIYSPINQRVKQCLLDEGYSIELEETSATIFVTEKPFDKNLHRSEKKRLRKCREQNFAFEIMPLEQLNKVYGFLEACREEKGYALSMPLNELQKLVTTFSDRMLLTVVTEGSKIIAANISIRVYDHVLYNFYHDHASEYDHVSPVVLLNEGLYNFCQQHAIQLLDLGTSNPDGVLNESLLTFKVRLGAQPSPKITFSKHFA